MSFRSNLIATYGSQIYVSVIGILVVPIYVRFLGAESYGLVGFFATLQVWFQLLDLGLTPTVTRQISLYRGGSLSGAVLRSQLRQLQTFFCAGSVIAAVGFYALSDQIVGNWLRLEQLDAGAAAVSVGLMGVTIGLRWLAGLYRAVLTGWELLRWLAAFNACVATVRFCGAIAFLALVSNRIEHFFLFQAAVSLAELIALYIKVQAASPRADSDWAHAEHVSPGFMALMKFSAAIALTSSIWIAATQIDKLLLSAMLPLSAYGHFSLAVLLASGVTILGSPIGTALMPRLTRLESAGDAEGFVRLYRTAMQVNCVVCLWSSLFLAAFAKPIMQLWTGDTALASATAPIVSLYALGNGLLAISAFAYYLQFAKGQLRLHVIGHLLFLLVLIPSLFWATREFGAVGAGYSWVGVNLLFLLVWLPVVHRRFVPGLYVRLMLHDVLPVLLLAGVAVLVFRTLVDWSVTDRSGLAWRLVATATGCGACASLGARIVRDMLRKTLPPPVAPT